MNLPVTKQLPSSQGILWDGFECSAISDFVGHENWTHKNGILAIKSSGYIAFIPAGEYVELDSSGQVINKIAIDHIDEAVLHSVHRFF